MATLISGKSPFHDAELIPVGCSSHLAYRIPSHTFVESLDLTVSKHGEPWQCHHHRTDTKILSPSELSQSGFLVRIAHKVDKPFEDLGIEFECIFYDGTVFGVFFILQHIHEGTVIKPGASPRFGQSIPPTTKRLPPVIKCQGLLGHTIHHLAPEFFG